MHKMHEVVLVKSLVSIAKFDKHRIALSQILCCDHDVALKALRVLEMYFRPATGEVFKVLK